MYETTLNRKSVFSQKLHDNLDFRESMGNSLLFPDQFMFLYNSFSSEIICHKGFDEFIGVNHEFINKASLFNLIHLDDKEKVKIIYNKIYRFWLQDTSKPYEQIFTITFRIKKSEEEYSNVSCRTMIVEKHPRVILSLNMISDITQFNTSANVLWSLKGSGSQRFYEKNRMEFQEYSHAGKEHSLTGRELEIVKCLAKGMDSKETARILQISLLTVYTHRRNMLTKMKFENILQLVNFALKKGLINV